MGLSQCFELICSQRNSVATLICSGRLVLGRRNRNFANDGAVTQRKNTFALTSRRSIKIDASGLGLLVELQAWAREAGRTLTFTNLSEDVWRLVIITKLYDSLEISDSDIADLS